MTDKGLAHPASQDRAGALRAEPATQSQAKPLVPLREDEARIAAWFRKIGEGRSVMFEANTVAFIIERGEHR